MLLSTTSLSGGSNAAKTPVSTTWSDSLALQRPTTHCKYNESGHSGTRVGNSSTSAPSDYHLFRTLSNKLRGVSFKNYAELRNWLNKLFTDKPANFYKLGIENLPERWEAVMNNRGEYIID
jgi:hypothetical protein